MAGFAGTFYYGFTHPSHHALNWFKIQDVPSAMASMAFLFLSHLAVLPMSQSLKNDLSQPRRFEKLTIIAYTIITVGNVAFGSSCRTLFDPLSCLCDHRGHLVQ